MYPFNSIIAQQEYECLSDVSRAFAQGRLSVAPGDRSRWQRPDWARVLGTFVRSLRARVARPGQVQRDLVADRA
jgi:hypothetical protein